MLSNSLLYCILILINIIKHSQSRQNSTYDSNYDENVNNIKPVMTLTFNNDDKPVEEEYIYIPNSAIDSKLLLSWGEQAMSPEYKDLLYDRKPLAEIVWSMIWRKIEPIAQVIKADTTRLLLSWKNKCDQNCHCAYSADSLKRFLSGSNDVFLPLQCPSNHNENTRNPLNVNNNNHDNITNNKNTRKGLIVLDKSMITDPENIEFEDEISVGLIKKAFGFIIDRFKEFVDRISLPEAPPQMMEKYVDKIKVDLANRERYRHRDNKLRLPESKPEDKRL